MTEPSAAPRAADPEVERLLQALRDKCGLKHDELLERKVGGALRQLGAVDRAAWIADLVSRGPDDPHWLGFVETVTVHETYFFREPVQLDVLGRVILPELLAEKAGRGKRSLKVWSAGCASGEEAYTVAMLVLDALAQCGETLADWSVDILGSDISRAVVAQAEQGLYGGPGLNAFRRMPRQYERHFAPAGKRRQLLDPVRVLARFRQHNLMDAQPPESGFDIVLCRNVFIYFDDDAQRRAVALLNRALVEGGHLLLGITDRLIAGSGFARRDAGAAVIYRKVAAA